MVADELFDETSVNAGFAGGVASTTTLITFVETNSRPFVSCALETKTRCVPSIPALKLMGGVE